MSRTNRDIRELQTIKQGRNVVKMGSPARNEGYNGYKTTRFIRDKGLYEFIKFNNQWYSRLFLKHSRTLEEEINETVQNINVETITIEDQSGIDHGSISGLQHDDHSQYLNTARHAAIGDSNPHHAAATAGDGIDVTGQQIAVDVTDIFGEGLIESNNDIHVVYEADNPSTINAGDTAMVGNVDEASRGDHQHPVATAAAENVDLSPSDEGASTSLARADHHHRLSQTIAPTWTGLHKFNKKIEVNRGGSSYIIDYAINSKPESNGRHFASGDADYEQNYLMLGDHYLMVSADYDTDFGDWNGDNA